MNCTFLVRTRANGLRCLTLFQLVLACLLFFSDASAQVPEISAGVVEGVGDVWQTVTLPYTYEEMIVVAVPQYRAIKAPAVVRIRNAEGNAFDVRVQNPSGESLSDYTVHYIVVEAGEYTLEEHGVKMEAFTIETSFADHSGDWRGQLVSYTQAYENPVVLGQVLTDRDERWSVFWARGALVSTPPGNVVLMGKHVGEDDDIEREGEKIGYIILETGLGEVPGFLYQAYVGDDSVSGVENNPPFEYEHALADAGVAILAAAGMDGVNGGWPVLWGNAPLANGAIGLAIEEDQVNDSERQHTTEQVAVLVLEAVQRFPILSTFQPEAGPAGSTVTINGAFLTEVEQVLINGDAVGVLEVASDSELRITIPDVAETGSIQLKGANGFELESTRRFVVTFDTATPGMNLCRLSSASFAQSSQVTAFTGPRNACDGIDEGRLDEETIAATEVEAEAWWETDLGAVYGIETIRLWNRTACCQGDLSNFFVFVSDAPFVSKSVALTLADPSVSAYLVPGVDEVEAIEVGRTGRYIRVQHLEEKTLGMAEVEIIATDGIRVPVGVDDQETLPQRLALHPVFPSPVRGSATARYELNEAGFVKLTIYDMLGRQVDHVVNGFQRSGIHSVDLPAGNLGSGGYILKLQVKDHSESKLFTVIR